jgi:hypothetical protein
LFWCRRPAHLTSDREAVRLADLGAVVEHGTTVCLEPARACEIADGERAVVSVDDPTGDGGL